MSDYDYQVGGATVVFSTRKEPPYNPLHRPPISYKKPIIGLVIYLLGTAAAITAGCLLLPEYTLWLWLGWTVLCAIVVAKPMTIWLVHLYQNKASDRTRLKCVFEPSCSEYMLLAIEKYGWLRGVWKGCLRLLRCHPPNGGKDYP